MEIGCLGEIPFKASSRAVQTIKNAVWSGSARYAAHERHLTNALTEFTGVNPDAFNFEIELSAFLGVNPTDSILLIWQYERTGKAVPLVIGNKGYGKYRWNILDHKITMETYDGNGDMLSCKVTLKLQEYLRE